MTFRDHEPEPGTIGWVDGAPVLVSRSWKRIVGAAPKRWEHRPQDREVLDVVASASCIVVSLGTAITGDPDRVIALSSRTGEPTGLDVRGSDLWVGTDPRSDEVAVGSTTGAAVYQAIDGRQIASVPAIRGIVAALHRNLLACPDYGSLVLVDRETMQARTLATSPGDGDAVAIDAGAQCVVVARTGGAIEAFDAASGASSVVGRLRDDPWWACGAGVEQFAVASRSEVVWIDRATTVRSRSWRVRAVAAGGPIALDDAGSLWALVDGRLSKVTPRAS